MASAPAGDRNLEENAAASSSSSLDIWRNRIIIPTVVAGIAGGGVGLISKYRKTLGLRKISASYATNFAIVTGCYCGAREFVRVSRTGKPDDLLNSAVGGFGAGAILGRLQGGPVAAARYSVIFAVVGTTVDYAVPKLKPAVTSFSDKFKLPVWSPIQVLDEEALAAKRAREEQRYRNVHNIKNEKS